MKKICSITLMLIVFIIASSFKVEYGNNVSINHPVYENLYIAGGTVTINAPIHGDLIVAGGTIIINDTVTNDILLAGGRVTFNGFVGDDIRCAGGNIQISKNVTGDVVVTGGNVIIDKGVTIGSLLTSGGSITVDGNINGEVRGAVGDLFLNGNIAKDIDCRGGRISANGNIEGSAVLAATGKITIGNNASFAKNVRYWVPGKTVDFKQSLKNGIATYDESLRIQTDRWYYLGGMTALGLLWYICMALLMIAVIQYLFETTMQKAGDAVFDTTLKSFVLGFLFFIGIPVAAIIAFATIIGVPLGLFMVFNYVILIMLAVVISSVVTANWFNNRFNYKLSYTRKVFMALGIFIVFKIISFTPFFGWLIMLLIVCISFGAILLSIPWKKSKATDVAAM